MIALRLAGPAAAACWRWSPAAATPGGDAADNAKQADEAEKSSRKIDVAKAGPVTLTVWDQEVRGGQRRQIEQPQRRVPGASTRTSRSSASRSRSPTSTRRSSSPCRATSAPDVVQANQGRPVMGQLVKGGLLRPLDALREGLRLGRPLPAVLLDLNRFSPDGEHVRRRQALRRLADGRDRRPVLQPRQGVRARRATFADFEQQLAAAKRRGEVPISFGNLDKWPGIHEFQTVQNAYAAPDAGARLRLRARRRVVRHAREPARRRRSSQEWAKARLLHEELQRRRATTRRGSSSPTAPGRS